MASALALTAPVIIGAVAICALLRRVDVFSAMLSGAASGLETLVKILPSLITLLTGVYMLRASGLLDAVTGILAPVLRSIGVPPETASLMLLRPVSGSGALAAGADIINTYGADSLIGRTAAVMLGSTETTFYVVAVYLGAAGIKKSRHAIPSALCADITAFFMAAWTARLFWGQ